MVVLAPMKLVPCVLLLLAHTAHAATFDEYSDATPRRPVEQLTEETCDMDVDLRGALVTIEVRQRIANPGPNPLAAFLEQELPTGAQVLGFAINGETALPVKATSDVDFDTSVLGVDPGWLQRDSYSNSYRVVLQPIAKDATVSLTTRYALVADYADGAMRFELPARAAKSAPCRVSIRATAGPGATVKRIIASATESAGRNHGAVMEQADLPIAVELEVTGTTPLVWTQTQSLAAGQSASLVTVLGPRVTAASARRVLFLVDGSRSMDLVGRHHVTQVIDRIGAALPTGSEIEAIVFDRTATRILGDVKPVTADSLAKIRDTISARSASNGSDLAAAFALAKPLLDTARGQTMLVLITDGVVEGPTGADLTAALGGKPSTVDVHTVVLNPAQTTSPDTELVRDPVSLMGGSFVEIDVTHLDAELAAVDEWLRPAWNDLDLGDVPSFPDTVRSGGGFTHLVVHKTKPAAKWKLTGRAEQPFTSKPRTGPTAPTGILAALATATAPDTLLIPDDPTDDQIVAGRAALASLRLAHPTAGDEYAFAVVARSTKIAKARRQVIAGGGKYERLVAITDPFEIEPVATPAPVTASAIAKETLARLFRDQLQPKAYNCYVRALGTNPKLAGTVKFQLRLGRGEITGVTLEGLGDAQLDACLLDAAYVLTPPLPDFTVNADDLTIANYPLTFQRKENKPIIILGDADSESPIDIEGLRKPIPVPDGSTPLGDMRPDSK